MIRFLKYQDRERVLRATASKERNTIQHDIQVKKELAARKILFALLHPAMLRILPGGQRRFFKTPKEAMSFIHKLHPEGEDGPE
ncbi:hypothetical protein GBF38_011414 [Nibea albiflora]|uniref:Uncharacterized protein n=1 Tax=Nibea albiflora TaxID=240163 RepID=A0ACB7F3Y6_NIBAL|nr:hypothetical protein GBF38_011414 [Nibea albiflora]